MPNATVRANARTMPKPKPGSAELLRQKTAHLESATALLNAAKVVEDILNPLFELEMQIRQMSHFATIVTQWALEQNFYHPDSDADDDTKREHRRQLDRLMFGLDQVAERANDLQEAFDAAWHAMRRTS